MARGEKTNPAAKPKGKGRAKRRKTQDEPVAPVAPVAPPAPEGFETWDTNTKLVSGEPLTEAQYNITSSEYSQDISVRQKEAFVIRPLTITTGPLQGRRVLLLEPVAPPTNYFRFMDLPIELRKIVYEHALIEDREVTITRIKPMYQPRRPVVEGYEYRYKGSRKYKWDKATRKWLGLPLSAFTLLRVCKQIYFEALTTAYGHHVFRFPCLCDASTFLDTIGQAARQRIRTLHIRGCDNHEKETKIFTRLLAVDCMSLRAIIVPHRFMCRYTSRAIDTIANACQAAMHNVRVLHEKRDGTPFDVLGLMQLASSKDETYYGRARCEAGKFQSAPGTQCNAHKICGIECKDTEQHDAEVAQKLRKLLEPGLAFYAKWVEYDGLDGEAYE